MATITIINDNLDVLYNKDTINVNEILKDFWNGNDIQLKMQFATFYEYFYKMCEETELDSFTCCNITMQMCNFHIPQIKIGKINLNTDIGQIKKEYEMFKKYKKYSYEFKTRNELISILIYHYITHNFKIKQCPICSNFFITRNNKIKYCSDTCNKKNNSIREMKRRKDNPIVSLDKKITDMLSIRNDIESEDLYNEYRKEFDINKNKYSKKEMINWLEQKHKSLKRR